MCSPSVKEENATKLTDESKPAETKTVENKPTESKPVEAKSTGAVPKVKVDLGKKRRRTRSKGSSLSPSPGRIMS